MIYCQHHMGDYARDTGHLSMLEHGAYRALLDWQYSSERALPDDIGRVFGIARAFSKAEQSAVEKIRTEFFDDSGWNKRAKREIEKSNNTLIERRVAALKKHHPELANMTVLEVQEWCKCNNFADALQCKRTTTAPRLHLQNSYKDVATRARSETPRLRDSDIRIEGGVPPADCQVGDEEILKWGRAWPGEIASGTPRMDEAWLKQKIAALNGRREWPANWQRWLASCWRSEWRTFTAKPPTGPENKKNGGVVSANVEEIARQKKTAALAAEFNDLQYEVGSLRANHMEIPPEKSRRLRSVREELESLKGVPA